MDALNKALSNIKGIRTTQEKELLDEIVSLEILAGELRDEVKKEKVSLKATQEELDITTQEMNILRDSLISVKTELKDAKIKRLELLKSLKEGAVIQLEDSMIKDNIDAELDSLIKEIDIKKITDKLCDGTARNPVGVVDNPAEILDNKKTDVKVDITSELKTIEDRYYQLLFKNSFEANKYLEKEMNRLRREGKLPN